jgi:hypothetical protein
MKTKLLLSTLLVFICLLSVKAAILVDKTMFAYNSTYNLNYCLPDDFDEAKEYPLIVAMHYCGGTAKEYRNNLLALCDSLKIIVVCPDNKSLVIPENREKLLVTAIDSSKNFFQIDTTQVYLTGMSCNGEFITRYGLKNFYPFKGIFPWDPWITSTNPKLYNFDSKMPIVLAVGAADDNYKTILAMYDSLKAHKATVNLLIVPGVAHSLFTGFSKEMINCIYYLNGTPDFSFEPIENKEIINNDSVMIDVFVNNPSNKKLKYSVTVSNSFVSKTEIIPGDNNNSFKLKVFASKKSKGKTIITLKAFDEINKKLAQGFSTIEVKNAPVSSDIIKQNDFSIYPVPVTDVIHFTGKEQLISINIADVNGKEMMNFENFDTRNGLQIHSLPNGCYILRAKGIETKETIKFIKQ